LVFEDSPAGVAAAEAAAIPVIVITAAHPHPLPTPHPTLAAYTGLRVSVASDGRLQIVNGAHAV
jgi:sugar-phosphatase